MSLDSQPYHYIYIYPKPSIPTKKKTTKNRHAYWMEPWFYITKKGPKKNMEIGAAHIAANLGIWGRHCGDFPWESDVFSIKNWDFLLG